MEKSILVNSVKKLEKDLFKLNSDLKNLGNMKETLNEIYDLLIEIQEAVDDSLLEKSFKEQIKEKQIIPLFKEFNSRINDLKALINETEDKNERATRFLERYRTKRIYSFDDHIKTVEFLEKLFDLYSITSVSFKPEFVGTLDLDLIGKSLKLQKNSASSLKLDVSRLNELADFVLKNSFSQNFRLESELIKIGVDKYFQKVKVETTNPKLKRLDRLCLTLEGTCSYDT